jgi:hypothetical protein
MTRFNIETFEAYEAILCSGKRTFYASDFNLCGGTIKALYEYGLIQRTGNTKEYFVPVQSAWGDDLYKKTEVSEWECTILSEKPSISATAMRADCLEDAIAEQRRFIKLFEHICEIELAMMRGRR